MAPQTPPLLALRDAVCCMGLGFLVSLLRALAPCRRSAFTFWADFFAVGAALLLGQGYAAQRAAAGELRWYMIVALALGAAAAQGTAGALFAGMRKAAAEALRLPVRFCCKQAAVGLAWLQRRFMRSRAGKSRKTLRKNPKKQLPKHQKVLYNSNIS